MSQFLRLSIQHSALRTQSAAWDSEQSAKFDMAVSVYLCNSVLRWPGRPYIVSDLIVLQGVAERALPAASRAEGPDKWRKMAVFGCFSSICSLV
jgi:hypothetical protein